MVGLRPAWQHFRIPFHTSCIHCRQCLTAGLSGSIFGSHRFDARPITKKTGQECFTIWQGIYGGDNGRPMKEFTGWYIKHAQAKSFLTRTGNYP